MTNPASEPTREAFEAWAKSQGGILSRYNGEDAEYRSNIVNFAWEAWQAAHSHARAEMGAKRLALIRDAYAEAVRRYPDSEPALVFFAGCVAPPGKITDADVAWAQQWIAKNAPGATLAEPQPTGAGEG